eukprot:gb/GFBE01081805.1/.p1 GENE.gb/GFBE01081805.1/~~gb/GFBE01081805.1/.p1  ORF type:complete len:929 (+),score=130.50 gb/GFBE01081805.1/:1-2787(+)
MMSKRIHLSSATPPYTTECGATSAQTRHAAAAVAEASSNSLAALPSEVWGRVALWIHPGDFAQLECCTSFLVARREQRELWRYYCHLEGYAQRVAEDSLEEQPPGRLDRFKYWAGPEVNWSQCFQLNARAKLLRHAFAYVRVGEEDLRIPAKMDEGDDSKASATQAWLFDHGWRPRSTLSRALRRMLEPCDVPLRFRDLIAKRPGMLLRRARFFTEASGTSAIVEWPIGRSPSGDWHWRRPPHTQEELVASEQWEDSPAVRSGPHPWGRGFGWLVELNLKAEDREQMGIPVSSAPEPRWVYVGHTKLANKLTVKDLCDNIQGHLGVMGFDVSLEVLPSCADRWALEDKVSKSSLLLSDLRWTQGERLNLRQVNVPFHARQKFMGDDTPITERQRQERRVVLFQRDTARSSRLPKGDRSVRLRRALQALGCNTWQRQASTESRASSSASGWSPTEPLLSQQSPGSRKHKAAADRRESMLLRMMDCSGNGCFNENSEQEPEEIQVPPPAAASEESTLRWDRRFGLSRSCDPTEEGLDGNRELPHERRLVLSSSGARQFEFHPNRQNTMLTGRKDGVVTILDHEVDVTTHLLEVDTYPILGLSWLHTNPQWAVCGVSQSGTTCLINYDESRPGFMENVRLEPFSHLSSLSVNCTDEYFMTSGFCVDLGLYDIVTGRRISTFRGMHQNFINILRFAHRSPHIFATASFDHTCKVWDLRTPMQPSSPVRLFKTDTLNVMCSFSPDDKHVLCSGVDASLQQFNIASDDSAGTRFRLPALHSMTNYRRSLYMTNGDMVATAATNESLLRICLAAHPHRTLGYIDFKGSLLRRRQYAQAGAAGPSRGVRSLMPRNFLGRIGGAPSGAAAQATAVDHTQGNGQQQAGEEYVQSLRTHPLDPLLLGTLLSTSDPNPESYIMMLGLGKGKTHRRERDSL